VAYNFLSSLSTNFQMQPSPTFPIKSILKPAIPLTPPKAIPSFDETRKRSTGKGKGNSLSRNDPEDLLIDFSTPAASTNPGVLSVSMESSETVLDPFSPITRSKSPKGQTLGVGTEVEQETLARELEAEERRRSKKQAILEQRAARRKSMANRRVSFAPEATLHTWNVVELAEDSTTSSASNSTRRHSSITAAHSPLKNSKSPGPDLETSDTPSTPPEQFEEPLVRASPAHQRDMHQKRRRRRSSGIQTIEDASEEKLSSSPFGGSSILDAESSPTRVEESINSDDDDTDADGDTAMGVEEGTSQSMASDGSGSSTQSSLDERLRRAATQAGTRGIEYDENGDDLSMEFATGTVTNAFQPWVKKGGQKPVEDLSAMQDQENINPFSHASKARADAREAAEPEQEDETQDMSMDVTTAVGGILSKKSSPGKGRHKSVAPSRRRSSVARRRSSGGESAADDQSMDLTTVGGGIVQQAPLSQLPAANPDNTIISDEDMSMEFTNVVGGVLNNHTSSRHESSQYETVDDNETMEMTMAVGGILPPIEERTEPQTDGEDGKTSAMDFTAAVNTVLPPHSNVTSKSRAKQLMEEEADAGQLSESSLQNAEDPGPATSPTNPPALPSHISTSIASETGSPSLALKPRLSGRSNVYGTTNPKPASMSSTPPKNVTTAHQSTPTKQLTPLPNRASTPNKTPIMSNVTHRGASPKKLFRAEIKARASPASAHKSASKQSKGLFDRNEQTGQQTPSIVLHAPKPHQHLRRRSSGLGIDQEGLGSPRIAQLLGRRASIGEVATAFVPDVQSNRILRFGDPRAMKEEVDVEREEEERRESGRFIMEQEADEAQPQEENVTLQLKEMIESMTPKKFKPSKLRGRKSLHVGAAKGILGKRPAELDLEDEEEAEMTPKRLKVMSREASPVKQVHLPRPPSKDETTGRLTRAKRQSLEEASGNPTVTPILSKSTNKASAAKTPQLKGRFKDMPAESDNPRPTSFEVKLDNVLDAIDISVTQADGAQSQEAEQEKIPLQTFLNMTNIHFIELSTTKRRHTAAPAIPSRPSQDGQPASIEDCFAAAATTLPLLELYQHATRELKSYISSGRRIIRSIEAETLEEQPALFREYVDARPDVKLIMDNQFRNGKTNARLQSKEGWYAWRAQLVDGLRGGLEGIQRGMEDDALQLTEQERVLDGVIPGLVGRREELEQEEQMLGQRVEEMEGPDQEALRGARSNLSNLDFEVSQKQELLERLQQQMRDKEDTLFQAAELKDEFQSQIEEAERVREECRGWSPKSVLELKAKVETIKKESGWTLVTAEEDIDDANDFGAALTMRYKDSLRLFFYPSAFRQSPTAQNGKRRSRSRKSKSDSGLFAPISLTYAPLGDDSLSPSAALPTEKRFFLQLLQSQLHAFAAMPKGTISARTVLSAVSNGWEAAQNVSDEIQLLNFVGITSVSILGDEKLGAKTMILLQGKSRVDVEFTLHIAIDSEGRISATSSVRTTTVYGPVVDMLTGAKSTKVHQALAKEIESKELGTGAWVGALNGFEQWVGVQQQKAKGKPKELEKERVPLSPKKGANVEKKPAPAFVTQQKLQVQSAPPQETTGTLEQKQKGRPVPAAAEQEKENVPEPSAVSPDWTPMTPIKRVGALRRSPIVG
jgi:kinetochore protein Spc7/SPC105